MKKVILLLMAFVLALSLGFGEKNEVDAEVETFTVLFYPISFPNYVKILKDEKEIFQAQLKDGLEHTWVASVSVASGEFEIIYLQTPTWHRVSKGKEFSKKVNFDIAEGAYLSVSCNRNGRIEVNQHEEKPKLL